MVFDKCFKGAVEAAKEASTTCDLQSSCLASHVPWTHETKTAR